jgi:TonB family protein
VRCDDCKNAPAEQHNFCECCGRPLPAHPVAPGAASAAEPHVARCESCGAPSGDMDLCPACQEAFQSVLETKKNAESAPSQDPIADIFEAALEQAKTAPLARPVIPEPLAPLAPPAPPIVADAPMPIAPPPAAPVEIPSAPPALQAAPLPRPAVFEPAPPPRLKPQQARPAPAEKKSMRASAPQPVASPARPAGSAPRTVGLALATVVIAGAIGIPLGQHFATRQAASAAAQPEPSNVPSAQATAGERRTPPPPPPAPKPEPASTFVETPPPAPKAAAAPRPAPVKPSRTPRQATPSTASNVPLTPAAAVVAEVLPAPEPVAPPPPAPEPAAPVGPFFQVNQVTQPPQVVSRVEPSLPADVQGAVNDVVIVRVLVSQAGQAAIVNLVRRSRSGPALDDAVVEAVKQWTFAPAKKRGEAVSCWFHVGVPVVRAN